jgi:ribonuclease-3
MKTNPAYRKLVRKTLGVAFKKKQDLFEAALSHPSYRHERPATRLENFDRLEFFGDAILNYLVCKQLFRLFPDANEGEMSRLRSILVSRKILSRIAASFGLRKIIRLGKCLRGQSKVSNGKILADTFEAVLAAVYFESGMGGAEKFLLPHLKPYLNPKRLLRLDPNPKSSLQQICQRHWQKLPLYSSRHQPPDGFITEISIQHHKVTVQARSRKQGEERAARLLIRKLRQELD